MYAYYYFSKQMKHADNMTLKTSYIGYVSYLLLYSAVLESANVQIKPTHRYVDLNPLSQHTGALTIPLIKVWSTVKICGTRVPQNAIVPQGRPRPYSIIILNMRFIPKASLRASSQITASSYILERHL